LARHSAFFFSGRRRHTRFSRDWSSDVCSSDLDVIYMEEGDLAVLSRDSVALFDRQGNPVNRPARRIDWTPAMAEKGGHDYFMHKIGRASWRERGLTPGAGGSRTMQRRRKQCGR